MSENDFECFASTGVKTPETMLPNSGNRLSSTIIARVAPEVNWFVCISGLLLQRQKLFDLTAKGG
jgi:hypothetical protein